eukprot:4679120-Prymnesium_polylepis.1
MAPSKAEPPSCDGAARPEPPRDGLCGGADQAPPRRLTSRSPSPPTPRALVHATRADARPSQRDVYATA